jgi:hypothetical protein
MEFVKIRVPDDQIEFVNELSRKHNIDECFMKWLSEHKEDKELQNHSLRRFVKETKDEDETWEYYR